MAWGLPLGPSDKAGSLCGPLFRFHVSSRVQIFSKTNRGGRPLWTEYIRGSPSTYFVIDPEYVRCMLCPDLRLQFA